VEEDADTVDLFVYWIYYGLRWPLSCFSNDRFMHSLLKGLAPVGSPESRPFEALMVLMKFQMTAVKIPTASYSAPSVAFLR
jgi:hypothetical protein